MSKKQKRGKRATTQRPAFVQTEDLPALGDVAISNREYIWTWLQLYRDGNQLDPHSCARSSMIDEIDQILKSSPGTRIRLSAKMKRLLLPTEDFEWIADDDRQLAWLAPKLEEITRSQVPREARHLRGRDRIIAMIDVWDEHLDAKAKDIEKLAREWKRHRLGDPIFEWFADKKDGEKRCALAWEWLQLNMARLPFGQNPITNYAELLKYFDRGEHKPLEQKLIIREIKKRWSRKQYDERNSDKKQVNLLLSKLAISQMDRLATERNLKRAELIEQLICQELGSPSAGSKSRS